jgi:hypothetical protein
MLRPDKRGRFRCHSYSTGGPAMKPIIGVDFDNTIVCYDELFVKVANERFDLSGIACDTKNAVRDYLRRRPRRRLDRTARLRLRGPHVRSRTVS